MVMDDFHGMHKLCVFSHDGPIREIKVPSKNFHVYQAPLAFVRPPPPSTCNIVIQLRVEALIQFLFFCRWNPATNQAKPADTIVWQTRSSLSGWRYANTSAGSPIGFKQHCRWIPLAGCILKYAIQGYASA
jgi:hypothetical protein